MEDMNKDNAPVVRLIMIATGPVIGTIIDENAYQLVVKNPCQIMSDGEGIAIVDYLDFLADHKEATIFSQSAIISVNHANPALVKEYLDIVSQNESKIFVPDNKIII